METLKSPLNEHPFLKTMNSRHREILAECAVETAFKPGAIVFRQFRAKAAFIAD